MLNFKDVKDHEYEAKVMTVMGAAASAYGLKYTNKIFSKTKTRERDEVFVRQIIWYFLVRDYGVPVLSLARIFDFNHSNILHAVNKVEGLISIGDKLILNSYYKPMKRYLSGEIPPRDLDDKIKSLVRRWIRVKLLDLLEEQTKKMENKVYNLEKIITDTEAMGYRVTRTPETVFVSYKLEEEKLPEEIIILRNTYGFMVQTEIE